MEIIFENKKSEIWGNLTGWKKSTYNYLKT